MARWRRVAIVAMFAGFVAGAMVMLVGAALSNAAEISVRYEVPIVLALAAVSAIAAAVSSFVGVRRLFERRFRSRTELADLVLREVATAVSKSIAMSAVKARVETTEPLVLEETQPDLEADALNEARAVLRAKV